MSRKQEFHASARCPICGATVIVPKRQGLAASILRALSLADHVKTLHPSKLARRRDREQTTWDLAHGWGKVGS